MATNGIDEIRGDFVREVPIPYILEWYAGDGQTVFMSMPNIPASLEITEIPPISIRHTFGAFPIREHNEGTHWQISLRGHVTAQKRRFWRPMPDRADFRGSSMNLATQGPVDTVAAFNTFLTMYQRQAKEQGSVYLRLGENFRNAEQRNTLIFRDLVYDRHFYVEPRQIKFKRNVQTSTCSAEFEFTFEAYKSASASRPRTRGPRISFMADAKDWWQLPVQVQTDTRADNTFVQLKDSSQGSVVALATAAKTGSPLDRVLGVCRRLDVVLDKAQAGVADGQRYFDNLRGPGRRLLQVAERVSVLGDQGAELVSAPRRLIGDYLQAAQIFLSAVYFTRQNIEQAFMPEAYIQGYFSPQLLLDMAELAYADAARLAGLFGLNAKRFDERRDSTQILDPLIQSSAEAAAFESAFQGYRLYRCQTGETWLDIANASGASWLDWQVIAAVNGAFVPELKADGSPLQAGDIVKIPLAINPTDTVVSKQDAPVSPQLLYGTDFLLDPETGDWLTNNQHSIQNAGGWTRTLADDATDFATVDGLGNVEQVLRMRLLQAAGSWRAQPDVGVEGLTVGAAITDAGIVLMAASVRQQVASDPRFTGVRNLVVQSEGPQVLVSAEIGVVGLGQSVSVVAPATGV
jgi:hypothetical protein